MTRGWVCARPELSSLLEREPRGGADGPAPYRDRSVTDTPETRYAHSGDVHIPYQILGDGPFDLIYVPNFYSHLEIGWEDQGIRTLCERLASFSRLIRFDKRGTGLSDRVPARSYEEYLDDITTVMEAAGSEQAALYGYVDGGIIAMLFAATFSRAHTRAGDIRIRRAIYAIIRLPMGSRSGAC